MTSDLNGFRLASESSFDGFITQFDPSDTNISDRYGRTALMGALKNPDPDARYRITNWLMDHGADPCAGRDDDGTVLHVLFSQRELKAETDSELLQLLLDAGADINKSCGKFGRPLGYLLTTHPSISLKTHRNPEILEKIARNKVFLDILFSRPDLNLTGRSKNTGESYGAYVVYLGNDGPELPSGEPRSDIEERVRTYLVTHGKDPDEVLTPMRGRDFPG